MVLKRLDDALHCGDPIRAIIRDTIVGQDGKTAGIMLPSREAQESLIRRVYQRTGINPKDTLYVEAHGTGTVAGDLAEIEALKNVFVRSQKREKTFQVGSIKANIGHLESASGIAGIIKAMLILEKGVIPGNPNLGQLKDNLDLESWNMNVSTSDHIVYNFSDIHRSLEKTCIGPTIAHAAFPSIALVMEAQTPMLFSSLRHQTPG